jgi:cytochrome b
MADYPANDVLYQAPSCRILKAGSTNRSLFVNTQKSGFVRVWDPVIRIGHWTLVSSFFIAYFSEDDFLTLHVWAGYVLGAVVMFRLLWGFIGSRHARFSDFLYSPAKVITYLKNLRKGAAGHYLGHNPAGGVMIILLLVMLSATTYTGLELYAIEENAGPLAALGEMPDIEIGNLFVSAAYADSDEDEEEMEHGSAVDEEAEEFWEELHEWFANLTLMLIILHVTGAIISSYLHRENLVMAMVTGKKVKHE